MKELPPEKGIRNFSVIETTLENIREKIREIYDPKKVHYIGVDAYDDGNKMEIRYWFLKKESNVVLLVKAPFDYGEKVPSISDIVKPAFVQEWEIADLFGINIEGRVENFFLTPESPRAPLRRGDKLGK